MAKEICAAANGSLGELPFHGKICTSSLPAPICMDKLQAVGTKNHLSIRIG